MRGGIFHLGAARDGAEIFFGESDDGGGIFKNLNANLEITQFYDVAIDPDNPDRVAEVASSDTAEWIVNVQGDEPLVDPAVVSKLAASMAKVPLPCRGTHSWVAAPLRIASSCSQRLAVS